MRRTVTARMHLDVTSVSARGLQAMGLHVVVEGEWQVVNATSVLPASHRGGSGHRARGVPHQDRRPVDADVAPGHRAGRELPAG